MCVMGSFRFRYNGYFPCFVIDFCYYTIKWSFLGGLDNPTPLRQADVNRILGNAEETAIENVEMNIPYSVDETVKVTEGPFSGFSGIIEEVNAEKRKLKVMVKIFGRKTPLELGFMQVEKE